MQIHKNYISEHRERVPTLRHFALSLTWPYSVRAERLTQRCNNGLVWGEDRGKKRGRVSQIDAKLR